MTYIELKRKQTALRRELKLVTQEVCEMEGHPKFEFVADWGYSGNRCINCGKLVNVKWSTTNKAP